MGVGRRRAGAAGKVRIGADAGDERVHARHPCTPLRVAPQAEATGDFFEWHSESSYPRRGGRGGGAVRRGRRASRPSGPFVGRQQQQFQVGFGVRELEPELELRALENSRRLRCAQRHRPWRLRRVRERRQLIVGGQCHLRAATGRRVAQSHARGIRAVFEPCSEPQRFIGAARHANRIAIAMQRHQAPAAQPCRGLPMSDADALHRHSQRTGDQDVPFEPPRQSALLRRRACGSWQHRHRKASATA